MVGLLNAPPGARLYERTRKEGRLIHSIIERSIDGTTNILPRAALDVLRQGHENLMQKIYSTEHYYEPMMAFLRGHKRPKMLPLNIARAIYSYHFCKISKLVDCSVKGRICHRMEELNRREI